MPSRNTYCLTWVSLTLNMGMSSRLLQQAQPLLFTLDEGYLLTAAPPDLEHGVALSALLRPRSHRSLDVGLLLWAAAPDLGHG